MANINEQSQWEPNVYQLDTEDIAVGGADGVMNVQAKQLGNRTHWLKEKVDQIPESDIETLSATSVTGVSATLRARINAFGLIGRNALIGAFDYHEVGAASWVRTGGQFISDLGIFAQAISGLSINTPYEYRFVIWDDLNPGVEYLAPVVTFTTHDVYIAAPVLDVEGSTLEVVPINPTLSTNAFQIFGDNDTHHSTDWRIRNSVNTVVWSSLEDPANKTSIQVNIDLGVDEIHTFEVRHRGTIYGPGPWTTLESKTVAEHVARPSITSPLHNDNTIGGGVIVTLQSSAFAVVAGSDTHEASQWQVLKNGSLVHGSDESTTALLEYEVPNNVFDEGELEYQLKVRHKGTVLGWSQYSEEITVYTVSEFPSVVAPIISYPANNAVNMPETFIITSTSFNVANYEDPATHEASQWRIFKDSVEIHDSGEDTTNLVSYEVPVGLLDDGATVYQVQVRHKGEAPLTWSSWGPLVTFTTQDTFFTLVPDIANHGPGPQRAVSLYDSATDTGYYGVAAHTDLITGNDLAALLGLSAGAAQNSEEGWLKFYKDGKVLYVAKKPFRYSVSWDNLDAVDAVYGERILPIGNNIFKLTLPTGAPGDPTTVNHGDTSQWNRLMYRVHWDTNLTVGGYACAGSGQIGRNWEGFQDEDFGIVTGNGRATWCKETGDTVGTSVIRGQNRISDFAQISQSENGTAYGWRPVLELIDEDTYFLGETDAQDLITYDNLKTEVGIAGAGYNDNWLCFWHGGTVKYIAKKPVLYGVHWNELYLSGLVYGTGDAGPYGVNNSAPDVVQDAQVVVGGNTYKVRMLSGAHANPNTANHGDNSEWNELMYPVHAESDLLTGDYACAGAGQSGPNVANYTNADLVIATGDGRGSWMKETGQSMPIGGTAGGLPAGHGQSTSFSPNDTYLAVAHGTSPYITIYKREGDTFTKLADPTGGLPASHAFGTAFSSDGTYLAVAHQTSPYITIYKRDGDTFTKLADPTGGLPEGTGHGTAFSSDGTYLAVAHNTTPSITIYKRTGDTFAKLADPTGGLPESGGRGPSFSPDGTYLAVAQGVSGKVFVYKRDGDTFAKLADPTGGPLLWFNIYSTAFSPDGTYLAVAHSSSPRITIYKRTGDAFAALADPTGTALASDAQDTHFSPDGTYLAVTQQNSPFIAMYKRTGDAFARLANPTGGLPASSGQGTAFSPAGVYLAVAHNNSPYITIYKRNVDAFANITSTLLSRIIRGQNRISDFTKGTPGQDLPALGWRPVLEKVIT